MKSRSLTITSLAAIVLFSACEKKEVATPAAPPVAPAPAPVPAPPAPPVAPVPAPTPVPEPAPAAATPVAESASEKEAIAALKTKIEEIDNIMKVKPSAENPMAQLISLRSMLGEMGKLPTDGLPTDLKDTVVGMKDLFGRAGKAILPFFEGIPTEADALKQWGTDLAADPAKLQEMMGKMAGLGPSMQAFDGEMKEKQAAAKTVFEKYGIKAPGE